MTRVKDLLRESQENALNMNKHDLDKIFNLELPELEDSSDKTSQQYFEKIKALRQQQKVLLPLFLQSKAIVARHKRCLRVILEENEENIPYQLQRIIDKGREGLNGYSKLLENIETVLKKNKYLLEQLMRYQDNITEVSIKTNLTEAGVQELRGDTTQ